MDSEYDQRLERKMSDLINRQAAIEDIRTMIPKDARFDIKWIEMWLMQLPSAQLEPQWIPVSKKLPNKNDYVIVTTKFGVVIEAQFEVWNSGEKEWWIDNDNSLEFDDVVAWMPMPQPYRGG